MRMHGVCLVALIGCGGDDPLTSLEGVYMVSSLTLNSQGCDAEGSATFGLPAVFVKAESFFGEEFVNVVECSSVEECKEKGADDDTLHLSPYAFQEGSDSAGWTSRNVVAFETQGMCMGQIVDYRLSSPQSMQIRLESRTTDYEPFAPDGAGECPDAQAEAAAAGKPCSELRVLSAAYVSGF